MLVTELLWVKNLSQENIMDVSLFIVGINCGNSMGAHSLRKVTGSQILVGTSGGSLIFSKAISKHFTYQCFHVVH